MEIKTYRGDLEVKQEGDQGLVENEFATLDVIDKDGDVTLLGAFGDQRVRLAAWNHGSWMAGLNGLPVGKGAIHEEGDKAIFEGEFFMDTPHGLAHFNTVKGLGDLQEWSYSFNILDSGEGEFEGQQVRFLKRMEVIEVAPVLQGAGIDTRTTDIKGWPDVKAAIPVHTTEKAPEDTSWRRLTLSDFTDQQWEELSDAQKRKIARHFAWAKEMPPATFGDLSLGHHRASDGAVIWRGCTAAAARLNQTDIPESDVAGVRRHLAAHYRQFDREPPWESTRGWAYSDHAEHALASVQAFVERTQSLAELRAKEGRSLSEPNRERLQQLVKDLADMKAEIQEVLTESEPEHEKVLRLYLQFQRTLARVG